MVSTLTRRARCSEPVIEDHGSTHSAEPLSGSVTTANRYSGDHRNLALDISRQLLPCDVAVAVGVNVVEVSLQLDDALRFAYVTTLSLLRSARRNIAM